MEKNEEAEIQYLQEKIDFEKISFAYDLGCGAGRHAFVLEKYGIDVIGVDYLESNIERAEKINAVNISFVCDDCRTYRNARKAQLVLCLYDVVGTFASKEEKFKIIKTTFDLLDKKGHAVFSVMNYDMICATIDNTASVDKKSPKKTKTRLNNRAVWRKLKLTKTACIKSTCCMKATAPWLI